MRVFQDFATLDLISHGRAEIMAGRGSFIESFPLFGYDLDDYDALFEEHLDLLLALRQNEIVRWQGEKRASIPGLGVYPRPVQDPLPLWVAVGGSPQSVVRAGLLGLPMALAIIGGTPERFAPFAELHRRAAGEAGHERPRLSINSHGFIADSMEQAIEEAFPAHKTVMDTIGRERGWPPMTREQFEAGATLHGHNVIGSPAGRDRQDPLPALDLRPRPLPAAAERRHAAARGDHARDRALRDRRRPRGSRAARLERSAGRAG